MADPGAVADADPHAVFEQLVRSLAPRLRLHCYRMIGTLSDAEDVTQEALERGWRNRGQLGDLADLQPWLYRIATNACLDLLRKRRRRLVMSLDDETAWPEPLPGDWVEDALGHTDPEAMAIQRESVGLAFLTAAQVLPPRQRAMLVLRDVLGWSAVDVAAALGTSSAAVHSGVRRARATVRASSPGAGPTHDPEALAVARRYLDAWERADVTGLAALLAVDARMAMPPDQRVFLGRAAVMDHLAMVLAAPPEHRITLEPTVANGAPAFIVLQPDAHMGSPIAIGVKVLRFERGRVQAIHGHMQTTLAWRFQRSPPIGAW